MENSNYDNKSCNYPDQQGNNQVILSGKFLGGFAMHADKTLFTQLMDLLPWTIFSRIVTPYGGDYRVRTLFEFTPLNKGFFDTIYSCENDMVSK